ncbi:MAG: PilN domain-containing protein [Gammaproteobacteria bacterium]|nr:PilN domain-containing protein [Gammaproteobacteria bacterium]
MKTINLLPWREDLRKRRQKEFAAMAVAAVIAMLGVVLVVHWDFNGRIEFQQKRNTYLKEQISVLDRKIAKIKDIETEKQNLLARMEIIQALQLSRPEIVHVFDDLVGTLPEGLYYTDVRQRGRDLEVRGVAQSNARVSSLMRNLDGSEWLQDPALVEIKKRAQNPNEIGRLSDFGLRFKQAKPVPIDADGEDG